MVVIANPAPAVTRAWNDFWIASIVIRFPGEESHGSLCARLLQSDGTHLLATGSRSLNVQPLRLAEDALVQAVADFGSAVETLSGIAPATVSLLAHTPQSPVVATVSKRGKEHTITDCHAVEDEVFQQAFAALLEEVVSRAQLIIRPKQPKQTPQDPDAHIVLYRRPPELVALFQSLMGEFVAGAPKDMARKGGHLVYFCVGHQPEYVELWRLCMRSILHFGTSAEFLVLCDPRAYDLIPEHFEGVPIHRHRISERSSSQSASEAKLEIFDWPQVDRFSKVLFLDTDILATRSIDTLFALPIKKGIIYSKTPVSKERRYGCHASIYHSIGVFSEEDMEALRSVAPFNCGQFLFRNSSGMRHHFECIRRLMAAWPLPEFYEQSFMNAYFNPLRLSDCALMDSHVMLTNSKLCSDPERVWDGETLVHFAGPDGQPFYKKIRMEQFYAHRLGA